MEPVIQFTPTVWSKILFLASLGETEVSGFATTDNHNGEILVTDFNLIEQTCSAVTTEMDDNDILDYMVDMAEAGLHPSQYGRVWIHTHPEGCGTTPSKTDRETFEKSLGGCDWAVMVIVNEDGKVSAKMRINKPVAAEFDMDVQIDYFFEYESPEFSKWEEEYDKKVFEWVQPAKTTIVAEGPYDTIDSYESWHAKEQAIYEQYVNGEISMEEHDRLVEALYMGA